MARPENVGVLALEVYVPNNQVSASDLENYDGVPGKYTEGLGQVSLSFGMECEDAVSMALTCVHSLLEKYGVDPRRIGRLEVGSESNPDRCKSIKAQLMRLMGAAGNHELEGADCVHGCYGVTAALFNSINWVESSSWDGRIAMVVGADTALYHPGSAARATGGAGAVVMLVGPNAPLVMDPAWRATYADNTDEFAKPAGAGPFPTFDGKETLYQFLRAADCAYIYLYRRLMKLQQRVLELQAQGVPGLLACFDVTSGGIMSHTDYFLSHAPYSKLVRKTFARMVLHDGVRTPQGISQLAAAGVPARWQACEPDGLPGLGYADKALEAALLKGSELAYQQKVLPGAWAQQRVGNAYTASLYIGLAGLWETKGGTLDAKRILMLSFGSGVLASYFTLVGRHVPGGEFTLERVAMLLCLGTRLISRIPRAVPEYDGMLKQVQESWGTVPFTPKPALITRLQPGTWYLSHVDEQHRRSYSRTPGSCPFTISTPPQFDSGAMHSSGNACMTTETTF